MTPDIALAFRRIALFCLVLLSIRAVAAEPSFFRAVNLNGRALTIDNREWLGKDATNIVTKGSVFENPAVTLKPLTDSARAEMIRSSVWGSKVDVEFTSVPEGAYQIFIYVWEDNHSERFNLLVNDTVAVDGFHSGAGGSWKKLGPFPALSRDGKIKIAARGGAANVSGVEVWSGEGEIPEPNAPTFVTELTSDQNEFFERRIRPLLVDNCYECHSADAKKIRGGLVLDSRSGIIAGGDGGAVIVPGSPETSSLIQAIRHTDPDDAMPPKKKLADTDIAHFEEWVRMGAPDPRTNDTVAAVKAKSAIDWDKAREFWSFRPRTSPPAPEVTRADWPVSDLDRFVLARMEQAGFKPAPDAGQRALIRRATYDLIGIPPTPAEIEAFLNDKSPDAFAKVVDRLLASDRYGERWGRHWLDVVRYADTAGDNSDFPIPQIYRYRDWVIKAINEDMPYDEFVRQQLAGDLLPAPNEEEKKERIIATGYIANARRFGSRVDDYPQHLTIEDTIDNLGRAFLGLTVSCARCHDHKFDPITAQDYYALYGIFHSTRYPWPGIELDQKQRDLVPLVPAAEVEPVLRERKEKQEVLDKKLAELEKRVKEAEGDAKKELEKARDVAKKEAQANSRKELPFPQAYAVAEGSKFEDVPLQLKGDPAKPGPVVPRGFLTVLKGGELSNREKSSGRVELATWLTDEKNPLPARVMANRIWLHHFGKGIVPTPNDFGKQGKPPTHPELLDWLASKFVESGWSMKSMHRLIMLSRTYQMRSGLSSDAIAKDPNNELLSAFPRRRLDAESIRDTLLELGGNLDVSSSGPHPFPSSIEWNFTQHNPFKAVYDTKRRSVYMMTQRIQRHPYFAIFDGADPAASTAVRPTSTTPLQALYLLNDPFVHEQSKQFASRLLADKCDDKKRWESALTLALGRPPTADESADAQERLASLRQTLKTLGTPEDKIESEAWQAMARAVFRLNEFVYID